MFNWVIAALSSDFPTLSQSRNSRTSDGTMSALHMS